MHVAGISPLESWEWTWGEGIEAVNAYQIRENQRAEKRAVALYNAAVFLADILVGGGTVKRFQDAFPGFDAAGQNMKKEMSDDDMYQMVRALNAQFGGEEVD